LTIGIPFSSAGSPRGDYSAVVSAPGIDDGENLAADLSDTHEPVPSIIAATFLIFEQVAFKNSCGVFEIETALPEISAALILVPLEHTIAKIR
jgi:hypothetical protein